MDVRKATKVFVTVLILLLLIAAGLSWLFRPNVPPVFAVGPALKNVSTKPSLAVGMYFAAMVAPDGSLWAWGDPSQIAVPRGEFPQRIGKENDWKQVTAGFYGLLALKKDGSLWVLGQNGEGVLGVKTNSVTKLIRMDNANDWVHVQAGVAHCMGLKKDGALWVWGRNGYGELGLGTNSTSELPIQFESEKDWQMISPGDFHCYALKTNGTIWGWGLDFGATRTLLPTQLSPDTNWIAISSGAYHLAGLKSDGTIWAIGNNVSSLVSSRGNAGTNWIQLGTGREWREVRSGQNNLFARKADGSWWAIGDAEVKGWSSGQDSAGFMKLPMTQEPLAMQSQRGTTLIMMPDGRLWTLGQRIGRTRPDDLLSRARLLLNRIVRILVRGSGNTSTSLPQDRTPYFLWAPEKGV